MESRDLAADNFQMTRGGGRFWVAIAISAALIGSATIGFSIWHGLLFSSHNTIGELEEMPVGASVHLVGKVAYVDVPGMRFWIQDQTGALVIPLSPSNVEVGTTVAVEAAKASRYDPIRGPGSLLLSNLSIHPSSVHVKVPQPLPVSLTTLPEPEKNGAAVQLNVIVRDAYRDAYGRVHLNVADKGSDIDVVVAKSGADYRKLVNADVRLTGLTEETVNSRGERLSRVVWVSSANDIKVIQPASGVDHLYSIRDLYRKSLAINDGHRVRIRGRVAAASSGSVLLEDRWGAIECHFSPAHTFSIHTPVEVDGFPGADGLRIDLYHASVTEIPAEQLDELSKTTAFPAPLATVASVRRLTPARAASALPVRVTGVVTAVDPIWRNAFLQDSSGGIYLKYAGNPIGLRVGERVTVTGITDAGNYAPVILAPRFEDRGPSPLPVPIPVTFEDAASGRLDSQYVVLEGIVHPLKFAEQPDHPLLTFELYTALGQIHVSTSPGFPDLRATGDLEDARIRIKGVFGTIYNSRRQLVGYDLNIASPSQIEIIEPAVGDPFALETTPIGDLLRFSPTARFGHRVKVAGSVTLVGSGLVYIQDPSGGVEIRGNHPNFQLGDRVEAVGYPTLAGRYSPELSDASIHSAPGSRSVQSVATTAEAILQGKYDSQLVTVEGRLLTALHARGACNLVLQSGIHTFTAQLDTADLGSDSCEFAEGSILRLTGVTSAQIDPNKLYRLLQEGPVAFKVLLREPKDIAIVRYAPFWTPRTTMLLLTFFSSLVVVVLVWVTALRRRVRKQKAALQRASLTTQAIHDLSEAMQEVSHEERFDTEVSVRGSEDIAQLVICFNRMLSELRQRDRAKREAEGRLQHQALIDELTGLPNRRLLADRLAQSLATAKRENSKLALLYIDLDGFKLVNDSFGHAAGDILLMEVGRRFRSRTRESDTLARIGGDEFTVILNHIQKSEDAETVARGLLDSLGDPFFIEGHETTIGASIGISVFPQSGMDNDDLLQQADSAMYFAKRGGKNRIVFFNEDLGVSVRERFTLENELRRALANGELSVHYQPEFDLATKTIVRFEALARWTHPTLGEIPPLQFIPVAEESGLIVPLGAYILERACTEALRWQDRVDQPIQVAVNVSSVQFSRSTFVEEVLDVLNRTGLPPDLLQLELTESATLVSIQHAADTIKRLKSIGITVAMDDFGTGYSCLSYLPKLAFDAIKIDRSFVRELLTCPETRALVESILTLARNLNMNVIVEGIESEEQLALVGKLGGDEAQGYLLGRPSPDPESQLRRQRALAEEIQSLKALG
ncbi:MAG: EAL domain-containing protein [Terracidiphilus sp.]